MRWSIGSLLSSVGGQGYYLIRLFCDDELADDRIKVIAYTVRSKENYISFLNYSAQFHKQMHLKITKTNSINFLYNKSYVMEQVRLFSSGFWPSTGPKAPSASLMSRIELTSWEPNDDESQNFWHSHNFTVFSVLSFTVSDLAYAVLRTVDIGERVANVADTDDKLGAVTLGTAVESVLWAGLIHLCNDSRRESREETAFLQDHTVCGVKRPE